MSTFILRQAINKDDTDALETFHWNGMRYCQQDFEYAILMRSHGCVAFFVTIASAIFQKNSVLSTPNFHPTLENLRIAIHRKDTETIRLLLKDQNLRERNVYDVDCWMDTICYAMDRTELDDAVVDQLCKSRFDMSVCERCL